jgi:LysM repeat protein
MILARANTGGRQYKVRAGDSLWSIAQKHDTSVRELIALNRLGNRKIRPGQVLIIPSH